MLLLLISGVVLTIVFAMYIHCVIAETKLQKYDKKTSDALEIFNAIYQLSFSSLERYCLKEQDIKEMGGENGEVYLERGDYKLRLYTGESMEEVWNNVEEILKDAQQYSSKLISLFNSNPLIRFDCEYLEMRDEQLSNLK